MILEPMTTLTDYVLAVQCALLGRRLLACQSGRSSVTVWAYALLAVGLAALAGGTAHGFGPRMPEIVSTLLWKATFMAIGMTSLFFLIAAFRTTLMVRWRAIATTFAVGQFVAYAIWMSTHDDFVYVIADYLPAMMVVLVLQSYAAYRWRDPAAPWIIAGILLSFVGAAVQQSGFALHRHFNHNDLYHVIQMVAVVLFYRGARLSRVRA